jgi:hypothetical protein
MNRIFDSATLETGMYQARELSYAADALDCHFIALSAHLGLPHFLSLIHYVGAVITALLLWRFLALDLKGDPISAAVFPLLFLTAPSVFLSGSYFRSSKILVALLSMVMIRQIYRGLHFERTSLWYWATFGVTGVACALSDRQGFVFLLVWLAGLGVYALTGRTKAAYAAVMSIASAVVLAVSYNNVIGPRVTFLLNGYWPNFSYQLFPWDEFLARPYQYIKSGQALLLDTARFAFGDVPTACVMILLAGCVWLIGKRHGVVAALFAAGCVAALILLNALMVLRHPPLVSIDGRRGYYWVPATLLVVVIGGIAVAQPWKTKLLVALRGALLLLLFGNILALPGHWEIAVNGRSKGTFKAAQSIRAALVSGKVPPDMATNSVYLSLR